jgi:hypothetical protein
VVWGPGRATAPATRFIRSLLGREKLFGFQDFGMNVQLSVKVGTLPKSSSDFGVPFNVFELVKK